MFRFSVLVSMVCVFTTLPTAAHAAFVDTIKGTVTSVRPCYPTGYVFSIDQSTTTLIFQPGSTLAIPKTAVPTVGGTAYTLATSYTTCDVDPGAGVVSVAGRTVPYFAVTPRVVRPPATTTPPTQGGQSNGGSSTGSSIGSQLTNFLSGELKSVIGGLAQPLSNKLQSALGVSGAGGASDLVGALSSCLVINFGGPVVSPPIFCTSPPGAALVYVGPPVAKPLMCLQGPTCMETPNQFGPPLIPSQQTLGCHAPAMVPCFVGHILVGFGFPVVAVGTSLPGGAPSVPPAPPSAPSTPANSCSDLAGIDTSTAAGKASAERVMRSSLSACGVSVNKGACPAGKSFRDVSGGCTDVSGLQCDATTPFLCSLAQKCGPFTLTGGTEAGHLGGNASGSNFHQSGNAADAAISPDCIKKNFVQTDTAGCWFRDPVTGTTFLDEGKCAIKGDTTGAHIHICVGGKGC